MGVLEYYYSLIEKNYEEVVEILLNKYGSASDDYFKEKSYSRFFDGEIKNITKGKYSRPSEGLECHHIDEDKYFNLSNCYFLKMQQVPYDVHKKNRLVYANIIEHAILHYLIIIKTKFEYGGPGYYILTDKIDEWYCKGNKPQKSKWHIACYDAAHISRKEAIQLLLVLKKGLQKEKERNEIEVQKKNIEDMKKNNINYINELADTSQLMETIKYLYHLGKEQHIFINCFENIVLRKRYHEETKQLDYEFFDDYVVKENIEKYCKEDLIRYINQSISFLKGEIRREDFSEHKIIGTKKYYEHLKQIEKEEKLEKSKKNREFYLKYPLFEEIELAYNHSKQDISAHLYALQNKQKSFIQFQSKVKHKSVERLREELYKLLETKSRND